MASPDFDAALPGPIADRLSNSIVRLFDPLPQVVVAATASALLQPKSPRWLRSAMRLGESRSLIPERMPREGQRVPKAPMFERITEQHRRRGRHSENDKHSPTLLDPLGRDAKDMKRKRL
jgi:hypothetical protein